MNNIAVKKNVIEISYKKMPKKFGQKEIVKKYIQTNDFANLHQYLESFNGKNKRRQLTGAVRTKFVSKADKLLAKGKNAVLNQFLKMTDPNSQHAPISKDTSYIGVEIECFIPYESVGVRNGQEDCDVCNGTGTYDCDDNDCGVSHDCDECDGRGHINIDGYSKAQKNLKKIFQDKRIKFVSVKSDGSIEPNDNSYFPVEVTVLTRMNDSSNLKAACDLLKTLKAKVNKSCGMHVHLDSRHRTLDEVLEIGSKFKRVMPVMAQMVPKQRRTNTYCKLSVSGTGSNADRYHAVNLTAFMKYKTIEIRLHSSTTNYDKIIQWATFLNLVANSDKALKVCHDMNQLVDYIPLPESLMEYCQQRIDLFSDNPVDIDQIVADNDSTDVPEIAPMFRSVSGNTVVLPTDVSSVLTQVTTARGA